jgi:hypothetical protein
MTRQIPSTSLFELLPSVYRVRDASAGGILENLCAILQDSHDALDIDIATLYENWFIETCAEWVVPYLGDLLGTPVLQTSNIAGFTLRGYVAATLSYRKRKGTAIVLEQLARDITNWPALAVECFELLSTTQYMQHLRPDNIATMSMRAGGALRAIGGPWDRAARTADLRSIADPSISSRASTGDSISGTLLRGKPNLNNIAIFLWRIGSYAMQSVTPRPVTAANDGRYRFHPAGIDAPLFGNGRSLPQFTAPTSPADTPAPLDRRALAADLEALRQSIANNTTVPGAPATPTYASIYFGNTPVLEILQGTKALPPAEISICDLSDVDSAGTWRALPTQLTYTRTRDGAPITLKITACVDPVLGRLAFPAGAQTGPVLTDHSYGFSGEMGGGPYDRTASLRSIMSGIDPSTDTSSYWQVAVSANKLSAQGVYADLSGAVDAWNALRPGNRRFGVIVLLDSETYPSPAAPIHLTADSSLLIVGAAWPSLTTTGNVVSYTLSAQMCRPHLLGDLQVTGAQSSVDNPGTLLLNGLLLEGSVRINKGNLGRVQLAHCTVIPPTLAGGPGGSITVAVDSGGTAGLQNAALRLEIVSSIVGPIIFPDDAGGAPTLTATDSIFDAAGGEAIHAREADATITGCTVLGTVGTATVIGLRTLSASNVLFTGIVNVERVQSGCARYCYLTPDTNAVPRRFRCQPDLALANITNPGQAQAIRSRMTPSFTSLRYGDPAYCQLSATCAPELCAGADDGSEMGAFGFLKQPQRDANLRSVLPQYLRPSFAAGIFYVS